MSSQQRMGLLMMQHRRRTQAPWLIGSKGGGAHMYEYINRLGRKVSKGRRLGVNTGEQGWSRPPPRDVMDALSGASTKCLFAAVLALSCAAHRSRLRFRERACACVALFLGFAAPPRCCPLKDEWNLDGRGFSRWVSIRLHQHSG